MEDKRPKMSKSEKLNEQGIKKDRYDKLTRTQKNKIRAYREVQEEKAKQNPPENSEGKNEKS